jgi:hypothetical protein
MIRLRSILALMGAVVVAAPSAALAVQVKPRAAPTTTVEIAFPARPGGARSSAFVTAPGRAARYQVLLSPEYDAGKHLTHMELELCRTGRKAQCGLLSPSSHPHGVQPFMFDAGQFATPASRSRSGGRRTFALPKLGLNLQATVLNAQARPTKPRPGRADYEFETLTVEVAVRDTKIRKG